MLKDELEEEIKATILIVDDNPANLGVLFNYLHEIGFRVLVAENGTSAIKRSVLGKPDIILLDILMPGLNGFETCIRLKSKQETQDIPIIFMTALDDITAKIKAFNIGAVDYITKPFQREEVLARINTHLTLRNLQKELQYANMDLIKTNEELDAFAHTAAHDLKSPLAVIIGFTEYLADVLDEIEAEKPTDILQNIKETARGMGQIVDELLFLASVRKEDVKTEPVDIADTVNRAMKRLTLMIKEYKGEINIPDQWPIVLGHAPWIEEIWANYLHNGLKYGGTPPKLQLGATPEPSGLIRFWVRDNGAGLTEEEQAKLFIPFTRLAKVHGKGHGLGLSIVQRIIEKLGGQAGVESTPGDGSLFYFTLPKVDL